MVEPLSTEGDHLYGVTVDPSVEESLRTQRRALRIRFTFLLIKYKVSFKRSYILFVTIQK